MPMPRLSTHTLTLVGHTIAGSSIVVNESMTANARISARMVDSNNPMLSMLKSANSNNNNSNNKLVSNTTSSQSAYPHLHHQSRYQYQSQAQPHLNVIHQYQQLQQQHNGNLMNQSLDNAYQHNHSSSISSSTSSPYQQIHSTSGLSTATSHMTLNQSAQHFSQPLNGAQYQYHRQPHQQQQQIQSCGSKRSGGSNPMSVV